MSRNKDTRFLKSSHHSGLFVADVFCVCTEWLNTLPERSFMKYLLCILGRKRRKNSAYYYGWSLCQILNYLLLNCTNDIHEDLVDFNLQLIHCTKTELCLSDFVLVLWWVTLKEVWTHSRSQAGIPDSILEVSRAKKTCRKPHVANNALIWISLWDLSIPPPCALTRQQSVNFFWCSPFLWAAQSLLTFSRVLPMLWTLQPCAGFSIYNYEYLPFFSSNTKQGRLGDCTHSPATFAYIPVADKNINKLSLLNS